MNPGSREVAQTLARGIQAHSPHLRVVTITDVNAADRATAKQYTWIYPPIYWLTVADTRCGHTYDLPGSFANDANMRPLFERCPVCSGVLDSTEDDRMREDSAKDGGMKRGDWLYLLTVLGIAIPLDILAALLEPFVLSSAWRHSWIGELIGFVIGVIAAIIGLVVYHRVVEPRIERRKGN